MSSPRFEPWLMPDTMTSGSKPSISPSVANLTQSTGVPSQAYPSVPSSKVSSVTDSGRRVVIERAVAERFESGAITASSTSEHVEQRAAQRLQPGGPDPVVVGQQNAHHPALEDRAAGPRSSSRATRAGTAIGGTTRPV